MTGATAAAVATAPGSAGWSYQATSPPSSTGSSIGSATAGPGLDFFLTGVVAVTVATVPVDGTASATGGGGAGRLPSLAARKFSSSCPVNSYTSQAAKTAVAANSTSNSIGRLGSSWRTGAVAVRGRAGSARGGVTASAQRRIWVVSPPGAAISSADSSTGGSGWRVPCVPTDRSASGASRSSAVCAAVKSASATDSGCVARASAAASRERDGLLCRTSSSELTAGLRPVRRWRWPGRWAARREPRRRRRRRRHGSRWAAETAPARSSSPSRRDT